MARRTDPFAPKPPLERRARQREVEQLYVLGIPPMRIADTMAAKYGVSARIIHSDMRRVRRRWDAEDAKRGHVRRQRQIRALEDLALRCRQANDRGGERQTRLAIGRLLGMGQEQEAHTEPRIIVNIGQPLVRRSPLDPDLDGTRPPVLRSSAPALPGTTETFEFRPRPPPPGWEAQELAPPTGDRGDEST